LETRAKDKGQKAKDQILEDYNDNVDSRYRKNKLDRCSIPWNNKNIQSKSMEDKMILETGTCKLSETDGLNIPVDIWLSREECGMWRLTASNYTPRTGKIQELAYVLASPSQTELIQMIKKYILPLYETAVKRLRAICDGESEELYFWK